MPALGLDATRRVAAQPTAARAAVLGALRAAEFRVTAEQLTRVEAKRGSRLLGGSLMPAKSLPILATVEIAADGDGCLITIRLVDEHINIAGRAWGWNQTYRDLFGEVVAAIDRFLARLDPAAATGFETPSFWSRGGEIGVLEQAQSKGLRVTGAVLGKANELLEGGRRTKAPEAWRDVERVALIGRRGCAVLSLDDAQAHLGVAVMVDADTAALPQNLRRDVASVAGRLEAALTGAADDVVSFPIEPAEEPVVDFLHQQVRIRSVLPARTLHRCRTCHFEKITNEDLERLQTRNSRLRNLVGGVGATISGGGVHPFVVLGQLFKFKKLDPDYVCSRCQGLDADERLVTFCPSCGELRRETVLRTCPKCSHDFRNALEPESFWLPAEAAEALLHPRISAESAASRSGGPMPAAPAAPAAPPAPAPAAPVLPVPLGNPPASNAISALPPAPPPAGGWGTSAGTPAPTAVPGWGSPSSAPAPAQSPWGAQPGQTQPTVTGWGVPQPTPAPVQAAPSAWGTPQAAIPTVPCPRCGAALTPSAIFCGTCRLRIR